MRFLSALLIAPVWLAAQSAPSAPADTTDKKGVAPPAPTVNHLETTLAGFKLSGFAEGSYAYSGRSLGDTAIVGRLYDRLRSEEHTSELQSHHDLVCRLLLEKKKQQADDDQIQRKASVYKSRENRSKPCIAVIGGA